MKNVFSAPPGFFQQPCCRQGPAGVRAFTLIEVLVSMTILVVIVLLVTNLFDQASKNWRVGIDNVEMNNAARAALDLMTRELESAVAGPIESACLNGATDLQFVMLDSNDVEFISLAQTPDAKHRALRAIRYRFTPPGAGGISKLIRSLENNKFDCYTNKNWTVNIGGINDDDMAERVADFYMVPFDDNGTPWDLSDVVETNRLPAFMDIHVKIVSREAFEISSKMSVPDNYLENNSRIFSTRVYFANRNGYRD